MEMKADKQGRPPHCCKYFGLQSRPGLLWHIITQVALGLARIDSGQTGSSTAVAMASLLAKSGCVATRQARSVCPFGRGQLKRQVSDELGKGPAASQ